MAEIATDFVRSETYHEKGDKVEPVWRIRHPDHPYYVGFVVGYGAPEGASKGLLGLIARNPVPEEAMQFGRRRDAEQFAQAFLMSHIDWVFEGPAEPPAWMEARPSCDLLAAIEAELAKEQTPSWFKPGSDFGSAGA